MARYYQVISADGHLETPPDTFVKHVPAKWKNRAPQLLKMPEGGEAWLIEGQPLLHNGQNITGGGPIKFRGGSYYNADGSPAEGAGPAAQRLREQDHDGIDAEVLFPPVFASRFIEAIREREVYCAMVQRVQHVPRAGLLLGRAGPADRQRHAADHGRSTTPSPR